MRTPRRAVAAAVLAGATLAAFTGAGGAAASPTAPSSSEQDLEVVRTLPGEYIAPLQFAVGARRVLVADTAASALFRVGRAAPIATGPAAMEDPEASGSLSGVAVKNGRVAYTKTEADHRNTYLTVREAGRTVLRVNLGRYERRQNPDGDVRYGAVKPGRVSDGCKAELAALEAPLSYTGLKDSNPYAVTGLAGGSWLVADAGGNDIVRVSRSGRISTVAVLPPQPVKITGALAAGLGAPSCVGITYRFEPVPTDVEVGPRGVHVTTLPGGSGAPGSVYRVGANGSVHRVATGFESATNLAISPKGTIYVVELGQGVSVVKDGAGEQVADLPGAAAVEWARGRLFASTAPAVLGPPPGGEGEEAPSGPPQAGRIVVLG